MPKSQKPQNSKSTCYTQASLLGALSSLNLKVWKDVYLNPLQKSDLLEGDANNIIIIFGDYDDNAI